MGAADEVREGAAETLFRASQVLGAKLPNDQRPTMRILGICQWGWGTGSVGSEPPERCLRPAQGSKTIDPSGAIIAICSVPVRARKSPCDTPRYWAKYWAQVIAKKGKTYTGVSVRDGARRRLVFSAIKTSRFFWRFFRTTPAFGRILAFKVAFQWGSCAYRLFLERYQARFR